jgi:hypothetical protein
MFAVCFPSGLVVGCTYDLTLTSSAAVEEFLPSGGQPRALDATYADPAFGALKNTLAGQIVALTLSVNFDLCDPDFGASNDNLGDLIVAAGPFAGQTVNDVLTEAELVLGGCSSSYSASEVNQAVTAINENFVDGVHVGTYLLCP